MAFRSGLEPFTDDSGTFISRMRVLGPSYFLTLVSTSAVLSTGRGGIIPWKSSHPADR